MKIFSLFPGSHDFRYSISHPLSPALIEFLLPLLSTIRSVYKVFSITLLQFLTKCVSYREFSRLVYGLFGNMRIPLPACAYAAIRKEFPVKRTKPSRDLTLMKIMAVTNFDVILTSSCKLKTQMQIM